LRKTCARLTLVVVFPTPPFWLVTARFVSSALDQDEMPLPFEAWNGEGVRLPHAELGRQALVSSKG